MALIGTHSANPFSGVSHMAFGPGDWWNRGRHYGSHSRYSRLDVVLLQEEHE